MHFLNINSELQSMVSWSHKPTTTNFDLGLSELVALLHIQKLFFTNFQGGVYTYKFIFEFTIFGWADKLSHVHVVSFFNQLEVDSFSRRCYQAFSSPRFWGKSLETRILNTQNSNMPGVASEHSYIICLYANPLCNNLKMKQPILWIILEAILVKIPWVGLVSHAKLVSSRVGIH